MMKQLRLSLFDGYVCVLKVTFRTLFPWAHLYVQCEEQVKPLTPIILLELPTFLVKSSGFTLLKL